MMHKRSIFILILIAALALSSLVCSISGQEADNNEPDMTATVAIIQITQTSLAANPTSTPTIEAVGSAPPTSAPAETAEIQLGSISGSLSFPSEGIPPLRVIAFNINSGYYYYIETILNQGTYKIDDLPVGTYHVVAYILDGTYAGGYSQAVPCGLAIGCDDHSLINVEVVSNQESANINPGDWYPPEGTFPTDPVATSQTDTGSLGSVSGSLSFPSEMIPPLQVVAFNIQSGQYYYVLTTTNQTYYTIENLPPGNYHIVAYILDGTYSGGYTSAVLCGLSVDCTDHSLINVEVKSGQETTGVDPGDWYAPDGTFPPKPAS